MMMIFALLRSIAPNLLNRLRHPVVVVVVLARVPLLFSLSLLALSPILRGFAKEAISSLFGSLVAGDAKKTPRCYNACIVCGAWCVVCGSWI